MEARYIGIKEVSITSSNNKELIFELDHGNGNYYCVNWKREELSIMLTPEEIQKDVDNGFLKPIDINGKDI